MAMMFLSLFLWCDSAHEIHSTGLADFGGEVERILSMVDGKCFHVYCYMMRSRALPLYSTQYVNSSSFAATLWYPTTTSFAATVYTTNCYQPTFPATE